ncbi:MAG: biotin/lipoyl-binding protein, partial [Bacteroidetes bacterium]|nr:biotin/lipoyl-binding protein [Bacteroidota bacterium]
MENTETKKKFNIAPIIGGIIGLVVLVFVVRQVIYSLHNEDTDNSQIEANINPIVPKVAGFIQEIRVKDNMLVHKGDTLVRIDDRDLQLKVKQAEVALAQAQANVELARASQSSTSANVNVATKDINPAQSAIDAAQVRVWQATQDYDRFKKLLDLGSATQQQFDNAKAAKELAEKQLDQAQKSVASYQARLAASSSNLNVSAN